MILPRRGEGGEQKKDKSCNICILLFLKYNSSNKDFSDIITKLTFKIRRCAVKLCTVHINKFIGKNVSKRIARVSTKIHYSFSHTAKIDKCLQNFAMFCFHTNFSFSKKAFQFFQTNTFFTNFLLQTQKFLWKFSQKRKISTTIRKTFKTF